MLLQLVSTQFFMSSVQFA